MTDLTQEKINVLDKLYNLKGEDSVIIEEYKKGIADLESVLINTEDERQEQERIKNRCEEQLDSFIDQSQTFLDEFSKYDSNSFDTLEEVGIHLDLSEMLSTLNEKTPTYKQEMLSKIAGAEDKIDEANSSIIRLNKELEDMNGELSKAESTQAQLNDLLNDILINKNDSYNRNYVRNLLEELRFTDENEISTLEFLILFPEKGLLEYERDFKDVENRPQLIVETPEEEKEEEKTEIHEETKSNEEIKIEESKEVSGPVISEEPQDLGIFSENPSPIFEKAETIEVNPIIEKEEENISETVTEEKPIISAPTSVLLDDSMSIKDMFAENSNSEPGFSEFLKTIGLDTDNFNAIEKDKAIELLSSAKRNTIKANFEMLKGIDPELSTIYSVENNNYMYLTDDDLCKKITLLRSKKISDKVIKEEVEKGNLTESLELVESRIKALTDHGEELTEDNINVLNEDLVQFYENTSELSDMGIELDDKEKRNYRSVLLSNDISEDTEILKNYIINIVRRNGKYALDIFWKNPAELIESIDDIIELGLEDLITRNPETLTVNTDEVIKRIKYCQENNVPIKDEEKNSYYRYIYEALEFKKMFGTPRLPYIDGREVTNSIIPELVGNHDYVQLLVDSLHSYYEAEDFQEITFDNMEIKNKYQELIATAEKMLNVQIKENAYVISGLYISKVKFERNLAYLLNLIVDKNESTDGVEKEIILTSILYNLRQNEDSLKVIVGNCLGFNDSENKVGGLAA